jgi:hypothetical protein
MNDTLRSLAEARSIEWPGARLPWHATVTIDIAPTEAAALGVCV